MICNFGLMLALGQFTRKYKRKSLIAVSNDKTSGKTLTGFLFRKFRYIYVANQKRELNKISEICINEKF